MTLDDYQREAQKTAGGAKRLERAILGLSEEAGEVAGLHKRRLRGDFGVSDAEWRDAEWRMIDELGDVLWYVQELALMLGVSLETVAKRNLDKLADRAGRGVIKGEGDDR